MIQALAFRCFRTSADRVGSSQFPHRPATPNSSKRRRLQARSRDPDADAIVVPLFIKPKSIRPASLLPAGGAFAVSGATIADTPLECRMLNCRADQFALR